MKMLIQGDQSSTLIDLAQIAYASCEYEAATVVIGFENGKALTLHFDGVKLKAQTVFARITNSDPYCHARPLDIRGLEDPT